MWEVPLRLVYLGQIEQNCLVLLRSPSSDTEKSLKCLALLLCSYKIAFRKPLFCCLDLAKNRHAVKMFFHLKRPEASSDVCQEKKMQNATFSFLSFHPFCFFRIGLHGLTLRFLQSVQLCFAHVPWNFCWSSTSLNCEGAHYQRHVLNS